MMKSRQLTSSFFTNFLIRMLKGYKRWVSPFLPPACRFVPTCSEYACEAIQRYGILKGAIMAVRRVSRCHPFCSGGYDPVK